MRIEVLLTDMMITHSGESAESIMSSVYSPLSDHSDKGCDLVSAHAGEAFITKTAKDNVKDPEPCECFLLWQQLEHLG